MSFATEPDSLAAAATPPAQVVDVGAANFTKEVLEASRNQIVLVDFWAEWCGPCKQLTPALERLVAGSGGAAKLAKINIEKEKMLAGQFQVQSIPMVYAFIDGRPVDGFMGALPDSQLKSFLDRLMKLKPGAAAPAGEDIAMALEDAAALAAQGAHAEAEQIYAAVLDVDPKNAAAYVGLVRVKMAAKDMAAAALLLEQVPEALAKDGQIVQLKASLSLATQFTLLPDRAAVAAAVASDPKNLDGLYALAGDSISRGDMDGAAEQLLESIRRDRAYNDGEARQLLLKLFDAMGFESEFTQGHRRTLSSILFS
jgi:putative thioredoxin